MSNIVNQKTLFILFIVKIISVVASNAHADKYKTVDDFITLDLESLMNIRISSTEVMGISHTHPKGEWMFSYKFQYMAMKEYINGTKAISLQDVFDRGNMMVPIEMRVKAHMLHLMYGLTNNVTLMFMLPYMHKFMDHVTSTSSPQMTVKSEGIGDIKFMVLYTFLKKRYHRIHFTAGLSLPSGSIDKKNHMGAQLKYPMQLGSGTIDFLPAITYSGQSDNDEWYWGAYAGGTIRLHDNNRGYTLGNRLTLTSWVTRMWTDWLSTSIRFDGFIWGDINGADSRLSMKKDMDSSMNMGMSQIKESNAINGKRVDISLGINVFQQDGKLKGNRLSLEIGIPAYQWLKGPQLKTNWIIKSGWKWAF